MVTAVAPEGRRDRFDTDRERAVCHLRHRLPILYRQKHNRSLSQSGARSADPGDDLLAIQQRDSRAGGARLSTGTYREVPTLVADHDSPRGGVLGLHRYRMAEIDLLDQ